MIFSYRTTSGQTGYKVEFRASGSSAVLQTIPLAEDGTSGEFFLTAAIVLPEDTYRMVITKNDAYLSTAPDPLFWDGAKQITLATIAAQIEGIQSGGTSLTATEIEQAVWANSAGDRALTLPVAVSGTVTTDVASRAAITDALAQLATGTAVAAVDADLGTLLARASELRLAKLDDAAQATALATVGTNLDTLAARASSTRLAKLDTVATSATASTYRATGFATPTNVTAARDAVIAEGNSNWVTANLTALSASVSLIPTDNALTAITTALNTLRGEIFTEGANWVTADLAATNTAIALIPTNPLLATSFNSLLTGDLTAFSSTALTNAPTGSGTGSGLTTEQSGQLSLLASLIATDRFSTIALSNAPTGTGGSGLTTAQNDHLLAIPTDNGLTAIAAALGGVESSIIAEGTANWAPDNATIAALNARLTEVRVAKLDRDISTFDAASDTVTIGAAGSSLIASADDLKADLTGIATAANVTAARDSLSTAIALVPTDNTLAAITAAVDAAKNAILTEGGLSWLTASGFSQFDPATDLVNVGQIAGVVLTGLADFHADLGPISAAIAQIPTNTLLAADYIAPNNAASDLVSNGAFTAAALQFAPTGTGDGGVSSGLTPAQAEKLSAIPTDNSLPAIQAALSATQSALAGAAFNPATQSVSINRVNNSPVSLASFRADVSELATAAQLGALPAPDNANIQKVAALVQAGAFTEFALKNAPVSTVTGGLTTIERSHLLAIPTAPLLAANYEGSAAVAAAVEASLNPVFAALQSTIKDIFDLTAGDLESVPDNSTMLVMADDGVTPAFRFQYLDAAGQPSLTSVTKRKRVELPA